MVVLNHIAKGTLTPEHVAALNAIYPALAGEMQTRLIERLTEAMGVGTPIPYKARMALSMFLGTNLDSTMRPEALAANQKAFAAITAQQAANEQAQQQAMAKITIASRTQTPAQAAAYRRT